MCTCVLPAAADNAGLLESMMSHLCGSYKTLKVRAMPLEPRRAIMHLCLVAGANCTGGLGAAVFCDATWPGRGWVRGVQGVPRSGGAAVMRRLMAGLQVGRGASVLLAVCQSIDSFCQVAPCHFDRLPRARPACPACMWL